MVKVEFDISKLEIEMLLHCIESAIDTEHVPKESMESVLKIKNQLIKYYDQ